MSTERGESAEAREFRRRLTELIGDETQEALATELGIDQSTLSRWLTGSALPSRRMGMRLARLHPELREALMDVLLGAVA